MGNSAKSRFYLQFLAGMFMVGIAGAATLWWLTTLGMAVAYLGGFATPLIYAFVAPRYSPATEDTEEDQPGYH